jgi:hypothetical protein
MFEAVIVGEHEGSGYGTYKFEHLPRHGDHIVVGRNGAPLEILLVLRVTHFPVAVPTSPLARQDPSVTIVVEYLDDFEDNGTLIQFGSRRSFVWHARIAVTQPFLELFDAHRRDFHDPFVADTIGKAVDIDPDRVLSVLGPKDAFTLVESPGFEVFLVDDEDFVRRLVRPYVAIKVINHRLPSFLGYSRSQRAS